MSKEFGTACLVAIAAFFLVVAALIVYLAWLHYRLHREICEHRLPEVLRDAGGRQLKERR
jgi:cell division protein FtsL